LEVFKLTYLLEELVVQDQRLLEGLLLVGQVEEEQVCS
jgi:hypothetical protein